MTEAALDEMVDGAGGLRAHWRGVLASFGALGAGGLEERARRLERASEDEGLAGFWPAPSLVASVPSASGRSESPERRCDPLPLPIPAGEFAALEAGLAQRASLLEAILADLYGPQRVLAAAGVPAAAVFANPGFLRPCRGMAAPLHLYAADLVRGPDGTWRVLADRTGAAGGAGLAQTTRRLLARVMPEAFRSAAVRPLGPFFERWQEALRTLAPAPLRPRGEPPSVALLTPGVAAPHWDEHMALAHALGCPLVEGGDLTARGGAVFLKTLGGLQRVDVLLRRLEGRMLDPLELESASLLGVPGLLDALRQGGVALANPPGAEALEAPGLTVFLPRLCLRLLGEELRLGSVPMRWLGASPEVPAGWRLRPVAEAGAPPRDPAALPPAEAAALRAQVAAAPHEWVAMAPVRPSVAPCLVAGELAPRPIVLRMFLVRDASGWQALPGGLARVPGHGDAAALAKDVWVLSDEARETQAPAPAPAPRLALRRTPGDLPSRVADNMFWLGRSIERLDRASRLSRLALERLVRLDRLPAHEAARLAVLGRCLAEAGVVQAEAGGTAGLAESLFAAVGAKAPVGRMLADTDRLANAVRDRLTGEMYGAILGSLRGVRAEFDAAGRSFDGLAHGMVALGRFAALAAGQAGENMVRGGGWRFLELGRRVERAIAVTGEVGIALQVPPARIEAELRLVLELCDSALTYRSRYFDTLQPAPVLDLVLADPGNPRGLAFQMQQMHAQLAAQEGGSGLAAEADALQAEAGGIVATVLADDDQAAAASAGAGRIIALVGGLESLAEQIARRFFALLPAVQTLGWQAAPSGTLPGTARTPAS